MSKVACWRESIRQCLETVLDWFCRALFQVATLPWYFTSSVGVGLLSPKQYVAVAIFCGVNLALLFWPVSLFVKVGLVVLEAVWLLFGSLFGERGVVRSVTVLIDPSVRGMKNDGTEPELMPTFHKNPKRE